MIDIMDYFKNPINYELVCKNDGNYIGQIVSMDCKRCLFKHDNSNAVITVNIDDKEHTFELSTFERLFRIIKKERKEEK